MLQLVLSPVNLFLNDNYQVVALCFCGCICIGEVVMILKLNFGEGKVNDGCYWLKQTSFR